MESMWVFFLQGGVGTLTCLLSKFERDRQPREILILRHEFSHWQQTIKFNKLTACDRLLGLLGNVSSEGGRLIAELVKSSFQAVVKVSLWAMDGDGDGDCDGCMAETPWLGAETDWYLFLIRNTGDKSYEGERPICGHHVCQASFAAMLFELEGSTISLAVAESSETTTGSVAEVDADWELHIRWGVPILRAAQKRELWLWWGKSMYPQIQSEDFIGQGRVCRLC